jgi:hypothetical protein
MKINLEAVVNNEEYRLALNINNKQKKMKLFLDFNKDLCNENTIK